MFTREKIYNVYEKPEASDPADRVVLLREGFSFWAVIFGALWLIANRLWLLLAGFVAAILVIGMLSEILHLTEAVTGLAQLWLQLLLGYHAYDLQGWILQQRGYRFAGVLVAESEMHATRRYYEFAA